MKRQIILGMGVGQCGTQLLAEILDQQPNAKITHQQPPLLPWIVKPDADALRRRFDRFLERRREPIVGDVATYYLPYVEEAIKLRPEIRIVCLKRPRDEVINGFVRILEKISLPINHWAKEPAPGSYHDPVWSRVFPQYDTQDLEEGIGLYWDEYYRKVDELLQQYPGNLALWDTNVLTSEQGVREVLSFVGISDENQVVVTGAQTPPPQPSSSSMVRRPSHPMDPRKCVVIVPFNSFIHQECENALKELERRGYRVWRVGGYAAIDQGRNQMATDAMSDGYEETVWIDSDVAFHPDSVDQLRSHPHPIVCGIYPQKGKRALACHVASGTHSLVLGEKGGLAEMLYAATGFLMIRREVYQNVQRQLDLPICNEKYGSPMIPFFQPMVRPVEDGYWYLAEDYAFCHRARECGYKIYADTSIRLWHIGSYRYGWEDAGMDRPRFSTFTLNFGNADEKSQETETTRTSALSNLAQQYQWPPQRPEVPPFPQRDGKFSRELLTRSISQATKVILNLNAWTGYSTRLLANLAPEAKIVAVDAWENRLESEEDSEPTSSITKLYETFLSECWDYRDQIIPIKSDSNEALHHISEAGIEPDLIYLSTNDNLENFARDLSLTLELFPKTIILGDGFHHDLIQDAVESMSKKYNFKHEIIDSSWRIIRSSNLGE